MENKEHESQMQLFEGRKVRTLWDEEAQVWLFSVVDVVAVLTESADPKQYIKKMRSRDPELNSRWGTICTPTHILSCRKSRLNLRQNLIFFVSLVSDLEVIQ